MNKTIAIHQPDFMPWLGLFNKISKANELIILDHTVNNSKSADFWCRRVKMLIGGNAHWMSISLKRDPKRSIFLPINEMEIDRDERAIKKFKLTVEQSYKRAPYFGKVFYLIENYFDSQTTNLSEMNSWFIREILDKLNIQIEVLYSSQLCPQFSSTEMLIDLLVKRNATTYISGSGAKAYQNDLLFAQKNIVLYYNNFICPSYRQFNSTSFISGLSIIDALMNVGFESTAKLVSQPE